MQVLHTWCDTVTINLGRYLQFGTQRQNLNHRLLSDGFAFCSLRRVVAQLVSRPFVSALVLSRVDYCNSSLAGLPAIALAPL